MTKMNSCPFCGEEKALGVKIAWFKGRLSAAGRCKTCNAFGPAVAIQCSRGYEITKDKREELVNQAVVQWNGRKGE